jgi:hypothetical protein
MSPIKASLSSGVLSGITGLLVFLVIHHLWIKPIWDILPAGLVIATLGGLSAGWAYYEVFPHLPGRPWSILAWIILVSLCLAPAVMLAQLRPPVVASAGMASGMTITVTQALVVLVRDLLLTATVTGGLAGWFIVRTWRAALATALAGFVFALGPGHNIPFLGNTPATEKGILLLLAIIGSASTVLVESHAFFTRWSISTNRKESTRA